MCGCLLHIPIGHLACNPDWEPNLLDSEASTQSTEPHQPGRNLNIYRIQTISRLPLSKRTSSDDGNNLNLH